MSKDSKRTRKLAVKRFLKGESPSVICTSLGRSRYWLYKWIKRFDPDNPIWSHDHSKRPINNPHRIRLEIEEIVKMIHLNLYNNDLFCGAQAIRWEMEDMDVVPLPLEADHQSHLGPQRSDASANGSI